MSPNSTAGSGELKMSPSEFAALKSGESRVWVKCEFCQGTGALGRREIFGAFGAENQTAPIPCFGCYDPVLRGSYGGHFVKQAAIAPATAAKQEGE